METKEEFSKSTKEAFEYMFKHTYRDSNKLKKYMIMPNASNREVALAIERGVKQEHQKAERFKNELIYAFNKGKRTTEFIQKLYEEIYDGNN